MRTFIDLCGGIGGLSYPLHEDSLDCTLYCDIDKFATKTYKANFEAAAYASDLNLVAPADVPPHDVMLAGFPCQPFSSVGHGLGFEDPRGNIFFLLMRIAATCKPKVMLFENVRRLLTHDRGKTFKVIQQAIEEQGYRFQYAVLDARHFVPQKRARVFIVATDPRFFHPVDLTNLHPPGTSNLNLSSVFGEASIDNGRFPIQSAILTPRTTAWLKSHHARKQAEGGLSTVAFTNGTGLSSTLTARYYKDGKEIVVDDGLTDPRKLTPRECARLMGFPDTFKLPSDVSATQFYKQFGNSVVVACARTIWERIKLAERTDTHEDQVSEDSL